MYALYNAFIFTSDKGVLYEFRVSAKNDVDYGEERVMTILTPDGSKLCHAHPAPANHEAPRNDQSEPLLQITLFPTPCFIFIIFGLLIETAKISSWFPNDFKYLVDHVL